VVETRANLGVESEDGQQIEIGLATGIVKIEAKAGIEIHVAVAGVAAESAEHAKGREKRKRKGIGIGRGNGKGKGSGIRQENQKTGAGIAAGARIGTEIRTGGKMVRQRKILGKMTGVETGQRPPMTGIPVGAPGMPPV